MPEAVEDCAAKPSRIHDLESFDKQLMSASDTWQNADLCDHNEQEGRTCLKCE